MILDRPILLGIELLIVFVCQTGGVGILGVLVAAGLDNRGGKSITLFDSHVRSPALFIPPPPLLSPPSCFPLFLVCHLQDDLQHERRYKHTHVITHIGIYRQAGGTW